MMVGFDKERIFQALNILEKQPKGKNRLIQKVIDYSHPLVSKKVLRIVLVFIQIMLIKLYGKNTNIVL